MSPYFCAALVSIAFVLGAAWERRRSPLTRSFGGPSRPRPVAAPVAHSHEAALATLDDAVLLVDGDAGIRWLNDAARRRLGVNPPGPVALISVWRSPALVDAVRSGAERVLDVDGPLGDAQRVSLRSLVDGSRLLVVREAASQKAAERRARDLCTNLAHELRTPISVIVGNSEILADDVPPDRETTRTLVAAVQRQAARLQRLVEELLELGRLDAGATNLRSDALDLGPFGPHLLGLVGELLAERRTTLRLALRGRVCGDAGALEQVLHNLVENAVKYGSPGGTVEVASEERDGWVHISVRDDGPGIDPAHRARLWERFYRHDSGRARSVGGYGLGLAIVKALVEGMGGTVEHSPVHPHGTCFTIRLQAPSSTKSDGVLDAPKVVL